MCARPASIAIGGYYPTPDKQVPRIAGLLRLAPELPPEPNYHRSRRNAAVLDPCAGDGAALIEIVAALRERLSKDLCPALNYFTCEMEAGRHAALKKRLAEISDIGWQDRDHRALRGDAFRALWRRDSSCGVGFLYLNPPYDTDREHGRLEQKFLDRFTRALAPRGVLAYVVPHYALAASAETLGRHYRRLSCYRFAGEDYAAYRQVVLLAERTATEVRPDSDDPDTVDLTVADPATVALVRLWAADASLVPELPESGAESVYEIPSYQYGEPLRDWSMREVDIAALVANYRPWCETRRGGELAPVDRVLPALPVAELLHRTYEVATPPRPAHIAAGLAAGLFNGQRIEPDDAKSKFPPLLVKGVFDREWRTVEEKHNKEGEKTGEVQVQQPKLVVTVLDLNGHGYHTLRASIEVSGARDVSSMGVADLLAHYGQSLAGVMERQCRVLYDPRRAAEYGINIPDSPRKPFTAQAHAVRACAKLLRDRPGRSPVLLGEIGSGKTTVAIMAARAEGARRLLAMCPPHLLDTWRGEVAQVWPEAEVRVLESVLDVDAVAAATGDRPIVAVLSREVAKLGHAWQGVAENCPRCGGAVPTGDLAKKRARCERKDLIPMDDFARLARRMALFIRPYVNDVTVRSVLRGGLDARYPAPEKALKWRGLPEDLVLALRVRIAQSPVTQRPTPDIRRAIAWLHAAAPSADHLIKFLPLVHGGESYQNFAEELPLLLKGEDLEAARAVVGVFKDKYSYTYNSGASPLSRLDDRIKRRDEHCDVAGMKVEWHKGKLVLDGVAEGAAEAAVRALEAVIKLASWRLTPECGEPLFQAVPAPRRHPLAQYIVKRHKRTFDFMVLDEGHEYANGDSAQGLAAHRLTTLKLPTVFMTGSVMNGYASSLHANMWALSPGYREEFDRRELSAMVDRYGYRKRLVQDRRDGEVVSFGSQTDRVERSERDVGDAPGVLPLFLFRHLLQSAVTIHKADLQIELPPCAQARAEVDAGRQLRAEYKKLLGALQKQIKADRFVEGRAGKLFGALAELPSYLDRAVADVGNGGDGAYEIRYPESCGGDLVAEAPLLPAKTILPKEEWLLGKIEGELAEGRNVMVFGWHLGLLPRLSRLIEARTGEKAPVLFADKVPTGKRQSWIDREIVKKKRRVMVANPVAIQTGLNNLVHFATEIWHENPACNPIVYRQAIGRVDRIGQKRPTRILFGYYEGTLQAQLYELLLAKVAISTATDGLDPESALRASGIVEDEYLTGLSIGKQLWAMISPEFTGEDRRVA